MTNAVGVRIKAGRTAAGLTQADLAGSEYSVAYVSRIESGERTPSPEALAVFAKRLGISPTSLVAPIDEADAFRLEQLRVDILHAFDAADWDAAREAATGLAAAAREAGVDDLESFALRALGEVAERTDRSDDAIDLYHRAQMRSASLPIEDRLEITVALARAYRGAGDLALSADLLRQAADELRPHASLHPALMARILTHLTATSFERGDVAYARHTSTEGLEFARKADDRRALANALWAAAPPMAAANPARALSLIRRAGTLYAELGLHLELGRLYAKMGEIARLAGDADAARISLDRAMALMDQAGSAAEKASPHIELGELELITGHNDLAAAHAAEAVTLAAGFNPLEEGRARRVLGEALSSQDPEAAERELRAAIELFTSAGAQMESARCFRSLGELLIAQGRSAEALEVFRDGLGAVEGAA